MSFKFGGKIVLGLSMLTGSIMTLLIPTFARLNQYALIACLVITGAAHVSLSTQ